MRHAGAEALNRLEPLLVELRGLGLLTEKGRGVFYARGRAVLHFHEDPAGLFADVRPPGAADFERIDVTKVSGQAELLKRLAPPSPPSREN
jgi:hypothetical protein